MDSSLICVCRCDGNTARYIFQSAVYGPEEKLIGSGVCGRLNGEIHRAFQRFIRLAQVMNKPIERVFLIIFGEISIPFPDSAEMS